MVNERKAERREIRATVLGKMTPSIAVPMGDEIDDVSLSFYTAFEDGGTYTVEIPFTLQTLYKVVAILEHLPKYSVVWPEGVTEETKTLYERLVTAIR